MQYNCHWNNCSKNKCFLPVVIPSLVGVNKRLDIQCVHKGFMDKCHPGMFHIKISTMNPPLKFDPDQTC